MSSEIAWALISIRNCIQRGRLRWFGHVERMDRDSWVKKCREIVVGLRGRGRSRKNWDEVLQDHLSVEYIACRCGTGQSKNGSLLLSKPV